MLIRKFAAAAVTGLVMGALTVSATAFAAEGPPGASACQPEQGQIITATAAQTGQLGVIISRELPAPINVLNQESLFNCPNPQPHP